MDECRAFYDPKCEELAEYCLEETEHTNEDVLDLARVIQLAVEEWWEKRNREEMSQRFARMAALQLEGKPTTDWQDPDLPAPSNPLKKP